MGRQRIRRAAPNPPGALLVDVALPRFADDFLRFFPEHAGHQSRNIYRRLRLEINGCPDADPQTARMAALLAGQLAPRFRVSTPNPRPCRNACCAHSPMRIRLV